MEPLDVVKHAVRCEEEGRLDDALLAWLEVARLSPVAPSVYERLFAIHVHRREIDAAFCAASVLRVLGSPEAGRLSRRG